MRTVAPLDRWTEVARNALTSGGRSNSARFTTVEWDMAQRCASPVYREYVGRPRPANAPPWATRFRVSDGVHVLEMHVRCRKCEPCLRARAYMWRKLAEQEMRLTRGRTWFLTLTCAPQAHFEAYARACQRLRAAGEDFDRLSPERQFRERVRELNREITLWLKRVRKMGAPLRYLLVAERHKSGLPHFHALVHEVDAEQPLRARTLRGQWRLGFSQARLVDQTENPKAAAYVAKYLSKSACARVRASQGYGLASTDSASAAVHDHFLKKSGNMDVSKNMTHTPETQKRLEGVYDCSSEARRLPGTPENAETDRDRRLSGGAPVFSRERSCEGHSAFRGACDQGRPEQPGGTGDCPPPSCEGPHPGDTIGWRSAVDIRRLRPPDARWWRGRDHAAEGLAERE